MTRTFAIVTCFWLIAVNEFARCVGVRKFPQGFTFGTSTSAYQTEGAWNVSDKTESIWDRGAHTPGKIADGATGDVAADSYHQFRRDVEMVRELGLDFYRFSVSWPRLLPSGFSNVVSEDGKRYYNQLVDELIKNGIEPMITIYHWDLPLSLQDLGGWLNPFVVDWFEDYARVVLDLFAGRVKLWLTINEPVVVCAFTHGGNGFGSPLSAQAPGVADLLCTKNVMLAHARVWRLYDREYRPKFGGKIGYSNLLNWYEPGTDSEEDIRLAELTNQFYGDLYSHPVFSAEGGWPPAVEELVAANSRRQGYPRSRLPALTQREKDYIRGTSDFFGVQHYYTKKVRRSSSNTTDRPFLQEIGAELYSDPHWYKFPNFSFESNPPGMRKLLNYVKNKYNNPEIFVTENGCPSLPGLRDEERVQFIKDYLNQMLDATYLDGVKVTRYGFWALMDAFEWSDGYQSRSGLYEVDFSTANRTRRARKSALVYRHIATTRTLDMDYEPTSLDISLH